MFVLEAKLRDSTKQFAVIDEMIGTAGFVRNICKSISDAAWRQFFEWLEYYGRVFGKIVIAVPPQYTSIECSSCHRIFKKSLSQRTHACECGCILDRDENASRNLLAKGLEIIIRGVHSRIKDTALGGFPRGLSRTQVPPLISPADLKQVSGTPKDI